MRRPLLKALAYHSAFLFLYTEASTRVEWERKAQEELSESITIQEQHSLCNLLKEYVLQSDPTVSDLAQHCYEKIQDGERELQIRELAELLPELITYAQTKAPRVDAPQITSPSAIAGDTCDLTEVIRLLGIIRSRIGNVFQDPSALTVLSTLGNPLELGPGLNIVRKLLRIQEEFRETWTILGEINSTVTACCAILEQDFRETWTILAEISTTLTSCCAEIQGTFTALEACCNSTFTQLNELNILITNDFNQTWTVLADINATLTECCQILQQDFQETWTILAELALTATIDFSKIFTALEACCNSTFTQLDALSILITNDFNQTWTILNDIDATLTECCASLEQDFQETWTILANLTARATADFSTLFTALEACCNSTFTQLNALNVLITNDFNQTATILADINATLTQCCATLEQDFRETWTILAALNISTDVSGIFTVLADTCDTAMTITGSMTITQPGTYCLINDIAGTIVIDADDVVVDLNAKIISAGFNAISIDGHQDILIKNGTFSVTLTALLITTCTNVTVRSVLFESNAKAFFANDSNVLFFDQCLFRSNGSLSISDGLFDINNTQNISVLNSAFYNNVCSVIILTSCNNAILEGIVIEDNSNATAFELAAINIAGSGNNTYIHDCVIRGNSSPTPVVGINLNSTTNNLVDSCIISGNVGSATDGVRGGISSVIQNNTIANNEAAGLCNGILVLQFSASTPVTVRNNLVLFNTGALDRGINDGNGVGVNNVFLSNLAQGHGGAGTNNFFGIPLAFIARLNPSTGYPFTDPKPYDNISVISP